MGEPPMAPQRYRPRCFTFTPSFTLSDGCRITGWPWLNPSITSASRGVSLDDLFSSIQQGKVKELNIILKADVTGSIGAIEHALGQLNTDEVKIQIIHRGTVTISEGDVNLAVASRAITPVSAATAAKIDAAKRLCRP